MLNISNLSTGYNKHVLKNLNLTINNGELLCIIGPNGCGKSTLLKAIINILEYQGEITYNGMNLKQIEHVKRGELIGLLSQNRNSYFSYSIRDAVMMGAYARSKSMLQVECSAIQVDNVLEIVDLKNVDNQKIDQISGGQFQRAMIARLLLQNPEIMMFDEPTNHLDLKHQIEIITSIKNIIKSNNKIGILVLHDLNLVLKFADKVLLLDNNYGYTIGTPFEVLTTDNINKIYNINIKDWMLTSLELWK